MAHRGSQRRRRARINRRIRRMIENPTDLRMMIARYNERFDQGIWYPFGVGMYLLGRDPCAYCSDPDARTWDHLDARARGGVSRADNLVRACTRCNKSKFSTPVLQYLVERALRRRRTGKPLMR